MGEAMNIYEAGGRIFCLILKNHSVCSSWSHWGEDAYEVEKSYVCLKHLKITCAVSTVDGF